MPRRTDPLWKGVAGSFTAYHWHGDLFELPRGALWVKDVAPSDALRRWYGHDPRKRKEFRRRYFAELDGKREAWEPILEAARRSGAGLLYSARDAEHNNAVALRDYLAAKIKKG